MTEHTGVTEEFADIDIGDRRRISVDDSLLHELDDFNDDIQPEARKMDDLLELAEDMLHYLPTKPKRVFSDKLAKWKAGEGKYSTHQKITDAGVRHSVVFTCIVTPVPLPSPPRPSGDPR